MFPQGGQFAEWGKWMGPSRQMGLRAIVILRKRDMTVKGCIVYERAGGGLNSHLSTAPSQPIGVFFFSRFLSEQML